MKRILLFIAAIACFYGCTEDEHSAVTIIPHQSCELEFQEQVRKGIKSITINGYSAIEKFGKQERQLEQSKVANYNKDGRIISSESDFYYCEYEYIYYDNGKIKKTTRNGFNPDDLESTDIVGKYVEEFDKDGNLIKEIEYDNNGIPTSINKVYQYDEKKRLIETINLKDHIWGGDKYKKNIYKTNYIYNDKGWLIEEKSYVNGTIYVMNTHKYDKKGNCIETIKYDSEGEIDSKVVFEYSDKNSKTCTVYDGDGNITSKTEYTPDEYIIYYKNGSIDQRNIFENKRLVEINSNGGIWRVEYNRKGDCTKVTRYRLCRGKETVENITECEYT